MTEDEVVANRCANLAALAVQYGSKTKLARHCGRSVQQLRGMIEGRGSFGPRIARDIEASLGLLEHCLDYPNMVKGSDTAPAEDEGLVRIEALNSLPEYGLKDMARASEVQLLKVEKGWLCGLRIPERHLKNLKFITAPSYSMEPTIRQGATLIIDHAQRSINYDGIFALGRNGKLVIHRVQCLPGNRFLLLSDHPRFETVTIDSWKGISILGRCLGTLSAQQF